MAQPAIDSSRLEKPQVGGPYVTAESVLRLLATSVDDITSSGGVRTYTEMLRDSDVDSGFSIFKDSILADGWTIVPSKKMPPRPDKADPAEVADAQKAKDVADFVKRALESADYPIDDTFADLLDACAFGNRCAEVVLKPGDGEDSDKLVLRAARVVEQSSFAYAYDKDTDELLGIIPSRKRGSDPADLVAVTSGDVVPAYRLLVFTIGRKAGFDIGSSHFRAAYLPWYLKIKTIPEWFAFAKTWSHPKAVGKKSGIGMSAEFDENGEPTGDQRDLKAELRDALVAMVNGTVIVVDKDDEVDFLTPPGDGKAFDMLIDRCGRWIHDAILGTSTTTKEAQHESRSSKATGQDVTGLRVKRTRKSLGAAVTRQLIRLLVVVNYGPEMLPYSPTLSFARTEQQDLGLQIESYSKGYTAGFIKESQLPDIYDDLGIDQPDWAEEDAKAQQQADLQAQAAAERARIFNPAGQQPPAQAPPKGK